MLHVVGNAIQSRDLSFICRAGYYACLPYSVAQMLIEVPYLLGISVMFVAIVYSMIGFEWSVGKFFWCAPLPVLPSPGPPASPHCFSVTPCGRLLPCHSHWSLPSTQSSMSISKTATRNRTQGSRTQH